MQRVRALLALAWLGASAAAGAHDGAERLAAAWAGEWNNNEQVWQQRIDIADPKVATKPVLAEHVHHIVWRLGGSALGEQVLFVQPAAGDDAGKTRAPYLLRLSREADSAVRVQALRFADATKWAGAHRRADAAAAITAAEARPEAGCETLLKPAPEAGRWVGTAAAATCPELRTLTVDAERWAGGSTSSRKVRYYTGWVWFRNAGPGASADDKDTSFTARFLLHNEGQKMTVLRKDGSESPWALELAVLTYQNTRKPILKLALLDRATGKSVSYTWTDTDGRVLGLNLGWFQAGMTLKTENAAFGF